MPPPRLRYWRFLNESLTHSSLRFVVSLPGCPLASRDRRPPPSTDSGDPRARADRRPYASVEVLTDLELARPAWGEISAHARASPYQSSEFALHWSQTIGAAGGVTPWSHATRGPPSARCCRWGDFDAARFVSRRFWAVGSPISRWFVPRRRRIDATRPRSAAARGGGAGESAHRRLHARKSALHLERRAKSVGVAGRAAQPELCVFERPARFLSDLAPRAFFQGEAEETSQEGPAARTDRTARAFAVVRRR